MANKKNHAKPVINAKEAIWLIRAGKSDLDLMERYQISSKGLQSLFTKLVKSGEIEQAEIDQRMLSFQRTNAVELVDVLEPQIPSKKIDTEEAVKAIQQRLSDAAIMDRFGISARGLESLFRKLVLAGAVTQSEIDKRALVFERSNIVELTSFGPGTTEKATISSGDAVEAIRSGLTDAELMARYGISPSALESLFNKLVKAGKLSPEELDRRARSSRWADQALLPGEESNSGTWERPALEVRTRGTLGQWVWDYKVPLSAGLGTVVGVIVVLGALALVTGSLPFMAKEPKRPLSPLLLEIEAAQREAEETIGTLEDIIRVTSLPGEYDAHAGPYAGDIESEKNVTETEYKNCLEDCKRTFPGKDEEEQVFQVNCRMQCIAKFSKKIKKLKERFYSRPIE